MQFSVYNKTLDTLERAVKERVFYVCKDGEFREPFRPAWILSVKNWMVLSIC